MTGGGIGLLVTGHCFPSNGKWLEPAICLIPRAGRTTMSTEHVTCIPILIVMEVTKASIRGHLFCRNSACSSSTVPLQYLEFTDHKIYARARRTTISPSERKHPDQRYRYVSLWLLSYHSFQRLCCICFSPFSARSLHRSDIFGHVRAPGGHGSPRGPYF